MTAPEDLPPREVPTPRNSLGWLWDYADALRGEHGPAWQAFAQAHVPSGRTDGTSWTKWRDECLAVLA